MTLRTAEPAPLSTVTVLQVGSDLAAALASHWFAAMGATVYRIDPDRDEPGGPNPLAADLAGRTRPYPEQSPAVDLVIGAEADLAALGDGRFPAPTACVLSISEPPSGAAAGGDGRGSEAALWLRSGLGSLARALNDPDAVGPAVPVNAPGSILAGIAAMVGALAALTGVRSGAGSPRTVAVDKLEVLAALPLQPLAQAQIPTDLPAVVNLLPRSVPAADGELFVGAVEPRQWRTLMDEVLGLTELAGTIGSAGEGLAEAADELWATLADWASSRQVDAVVEQCQGLHVPIVAIRRPADLVDDVHLGKRGLFVHQDDGSRSLRLPWLVTPRADPGPGTDARPAPLASGERGLPLAGVRVLDLTWAWAGPFATTLLADLGAEVINIEWEPRPSNLRLQRPFAGGRPHHSGGGWWSANQRGKLSVGVNLKDEQGTRIITDLARISDVAIENFSPGVVARLGIGPDELCRVNPALVYASMSAFGQTGPAAHYVGYGTQIQAASGAMFTSLPESGRPWMTTIPLADPVSGFAGAVAVLAHLLSARGDGRGAHLDISELEAMCWSILEPLLEAINGTGTGSDVAAAPSPRTAPTPSDVLGDEYLADRAFWARDRARAMQESEIRIPGPLWTLDGRRPPLVRGAPDLFADTDDVLTGLLGYSAADVGRMRDSGAIR